MVGMILMTGMIIKFITQLSQIAMIGGIIILIGWVGYLLYQKRERAKQLSLNNPADTFVHKLVTFASFIAGKIKK